MRVAFSDSDGGFTRIALWKLNGLLKGPLHTGLELTCANPERRDDYSRYGIAEAVSTLRACDADFALLPLQNTVSGFHQTTLDALARLDLQVIAEITTKIEHALVAPRMAVLGVGDLDYKTYAGRPIPHEKAVRAAIIFAKKLRDIYGHPHSFEQCEAAILNEDLPRKDHHRWQTDPVRMIGQMIECLLSGTEAKEIADALRFMSGGGGGGGPAPIAPWGTSGGGETDLGLSGGHFCADVQRPNPFIAALGPKGLYPTWREKEPGSAFAEPPPYGAIAPHYLSEQMIELAHPVCQKLDVANNFTRFVLVGRGDGAHNKTVKEALRKSLEPAAGLTTKIESFNVHRKMLLSANAKTQLDWQKAFKDTQEELLKFPSVLPSPCFLPPQRIVHAGKTVALMEIVRMEAPTAAKDKKAHAKALPTSAELEKMFGEHLKHKAHWSDLFSWSVEPPKADGLKLLGVYPSLDEGDANYGKADLCKKDDGGIGPLLRALIAIFVISTMFVVTLYALSCLHKQTRWLDNHPQFNKEYPLVKQAAEWVGQFCYSSACTDSGPQTAPADKTGGAAEEPSPPVPVTREEAKPAQVGAERPEAEGPKGAGEIDQCPVIVTETITKEVPASLPACRPPCDTDTRCVVYRKQDGTAGTRCLKPCPTAGAVEPKRKPQTFE